MSVFRVVLILDDSVAAQATLLTNIQSTLSSIASNLPPTNAGGLSNNNIEVRKLS